jgi:DNA-binding IclR family transcriptional regulator
MRTSLTGFFAVPKVIPSPFKATPVDRVLQLLITIAEQGEPISAKKLVDLTGLPSSSLYRHLASLRRWGYIEESERDSTYELGPICLQLACTGRSARLISLARREMEQLAAQTGETVGLMVAVDTHVICVDIVESTQSLRCSFHRGARVPLVRGASAKAQMAFLNKREWREVCKNYFSELSGEAMRALELELDHIRMRGYAVSESEVDPDVWGVSVPLLNRSNRLLGGLTLMAPVVRVNGKQPSLVQALLMATGRISAQL